jgi:uncharacterized protein YfaS (alpha-2-macroglobulin family)
MTRSLSLGRVGVVFLFAGVLAVAASSQNPNAATLRSRAQKLLRDGNFREAYDGYRRLLLDANSAAVPQDLEQAVQCLNNLGRIQEFDDLVEKTVSAQARNWRMLQTAAQQYIQVEHQGFRIAGKFERGGHRGGGEAMSSTERDRVRGLQLLLQAMPLAAQDNKKDDVSQFWMNVAEGLLNYRGYTEAWRLQYLTDLSTLPDYEEGHYWWREYNGAPVDAEGQPVYHKVPQSWDGAATDGERWRWALSQSIENSPNRLNAVRYHLAQFFEQQFGVQSIAQGPGLFFGAPEDEKQDESGTYALHTLKDSETIARLASGVKRFELPDEFNPIKLYEQIIAEPRTGLVEVALQQLAEIYENRRQYPKAAELWKMSIQQFGAGQNRWKQERLAQIVGNWGEFDPATSQPAGEGAKVGFKFRNGKQVKFEAREIKVDVLLADLKAYLKSDPANRIDWNKVNLGNIGHRLVNENEVKYVGQAVANWDLELDPRPNHFDRRITVTTPLQKAGAYLVTATIEGGNVSKIVLWVADTAIVHKQLSGKNLYFIADAVSGQPLAEMNVEFFGWQQRHLGNNRYQVVTTNFAETSGRDGLLIPDPRDLKTDFQWLVTAHSGQARGLPHDAGRLAFLGFAGVWSGQHYDAQYNQVKLFTITDRPVYRPNQKVHFKLWIARAQYDNEGYDFAERVVPIVITNPRGEKIYERSLKADAYGGIEDELELPTDATLGVYTIALGNNHNIPLAGLTGNHFRVEEYKKPEFEVRIEAPSEPVMLGEKITAKIEAKYYFGSPVTQATVKYKVLRSKHSDTWYPLAAWDWCYGPGYWWFAYDYSWYPGFDKWVGCRRPLPIWWPRFDRTPPEVVAEVERPIGEDGTIEVEIDTLLAKELYGDSDHKYSITAEVRDQSRRTIVGQGNVLVARKPFKVYAWVDRGYYRVGDAIVAHFSAQTLDRKPVSGRGELKLLKITYDPQKKPIETAVQTWSVDTDVEGRAKQQIQASAAGQYRLSYTLTDTAGHAIEGGYIFTVLGEGTDGSQFRFNSVELVPDKAEYAPGDAVKLQLNTDRADSTVLLFVRPANGVYLEPKVLRVRGKTTIEDIAVVQKDMPNFFVEAVTISGGRIHSETKEIVVPPEKRILNVEVEPSKEEYKPGEKSKVRVHLTDAAGKDFVGQTVLTIYDKSVEYISGGSNVGDIKEFFWKWRRHHQPQRHDSLAKWENNLTLPGKPAMGFLGVFGASVAEELEALDDKSGLESADKFGRGRLNLNMYGGGLPGAGGRLRGMAMLTDGAMPVPAAAPMEANSMLGAVSETQLRREAFFAGGEAEALPTQAALVEPTVRTNFADTAKWIGALETNAQGRAEVELDMPENLTTWRIRVWALGGGTRVGSGEAEVVTRKNLIVRLQAPRFFVQKDEVVLTANVHNYLAADKEVTVSLELPGDVLAPMDGASLTQVIKVPANGEQRVDWRCRVASEGQATVRMKALTDEESDATELKLPSYIHGILKTESWAGTVRPDKNSARLTFNVPAERRVEQSLLEIRYSPSLALAMVDALPYLAEYPYGCTEQTLNRFLPSVITQKVLQRMNLNLAAIGEKRTNLNAQEIGVDRDRAAQWQRFDRNPVFDETELARMVKEGVKALTEQQVSDGGWGWFSGVGERSYPHTTAVVVHGLQLAVANDVAIVPGVLERGIEWLRRYQAEQLTWLKNFEAKRENVTKKQYCDALDAFVYMVLVDAAAENTEMRERLYRDRVQLPVYAKAMFGVALEKIGDREKLAMVMRNIEQFLVQDEENETAYLRLPEDNWWWLWYGSDVEANAYYLKLLAKTDAKGEKAPRLVKYLLNNRKHATYWRSTRDTAICVEAFADYLAAAGENEPDMTVEVWLDGEKLKEVAINKDNLFSYDNRFVLEGAAVKTGGHELELRRRGTGPVYFNAYLTNFTLEDHIAKAGLEVKVERQYYKLVPVDKTIKTEGSRGQALDQKVEKYDRQPLKDGDALTSGDLVEVELVIESKNDYEYLMFEDMKPAGFEAVEQRSGYNTKGMPAYVEYRDNRAAFFVRQLARGRHSLAYRLRAEIPGRFSALPTQATAMYAPELRGNSDEIKLRVED